MTPKTCCPKPQDVTWYLLGLTRPTVRTLIPAPATVRLHARAGTEPAPKEPPAPKPSRLPRDRGHRAVTRGPRPSPRTRAPPASSSVTHTAPHPFSDENQPRRSHPVLTGVPDRRAPRGHGRFRRSSLAPRWFRPPRPWARPAPGPAPGPAPKQLFWSNGEGTLSAPLLCFTHGSEEM